MRGSGRPLPSLAVFLVVLVVLLVLVNAGGTVFGQPGRAWAAPKRTAIVALGDSTAAGEGAGAYLAGTRGERSDWCHRSPNAYVRKTGLAPVAVNLACSGATSADVAFGGAPHYTETSQAARLVTVARTYQVRTVVVEVGANDEPAFGRSVVSCVVAYLAPSAPGCAATLARQWPDRLRSMQPKVVKALRDVRAAMRQAGYPDTGYTLVLLSYPSPVSEKMVRTHGFVGCPFRTSDAEWGRTTAAPQLSEALQQAADQADARFLDLSRAGEGHEACTTTGPEWMRRLTVDPKAFSQGGLAAFRHLAQESFHLNAVGNARIAACLAEFVRSGARNARCLSGRDGRLHPVAGTVAGSTG